MTHRPTDKTRLQVEALSAYGITHEHIAAIIGISPSVMRKHYADELTLGRSKMVAQVANSLVKKALSDRPDAVNAAKFFLQSQGGWTERQSLEASGPGGKPIEVKRIELVAVDVNPAD